MAYDEGVAQRLREYFADCPDVVERKMFGGLAFMLAGHMCVGVVGSTLMARVGPAQYQAALALHHVREMDFTGKPLKGFVYVMPAGFESDRELAEWVQRCEQFVRGLPPK